jgi:hypothetical protein
MPESIGFDWFVNKIHLVFEELPDFRLPGPALKYTIKDAASGAFSMFFSQSPSFLSYMRAMKQFQGKSDAESLFGIDLIPTDNQIRNLSDPITPDALYSVFSTAFEESENHGYLETCRFLKGVTFFPLMEPNISVLQRFIVRIVRKPVMKMAKCPAPIKS